MKRSLITKIVVTIATVVALMSMVSIFTFYSANKEVAQILQEKQRHYIVSRINQQKQERIDEEITYIKLYAEAIEGAVAQSLYQLDQKVLEETLLSFAKLRSIQAIYIEDKIMDHFYFGIERSNNGELKLLTSAPTTTTKATMLRYPLKVDGRLIGEMKIIYDINTIINSLNEQQKRDFARLDEESRMIQKRMDIYFYRQILIFIVSMVLIMVLISYLLHRLVNRPLKVVQENMKGFFAFFHDAHKYFEPVRLKTGDEFEVMSEEINSNIEAVLEMHRELEETQLEILFTVGTIAEARSQETGLHVQRVAEYSKLLASYYGLDEDEVRIVAHASAMHDIGKIAIPDSILTKPGKLTSDEFEQIKQHTLHGYNMLKHSKRKMLQASAIIAYEHHERYDGKGYPRGLEADEIHIYGRIVALADVFDALSSERVYKQAWSDEKIFALFKEESGKQFDPKLVSIFFEHLDSFLAVRERLREA